MRARWPAIATSGGLMIAVAAAVLAVSAAGSVGGNAPRLIGRPSWAGSGAARAAAVTSGQAGYVATGKRFRYAQAVITVPAQPCRAGNGRPRVYVALAGPGGYARAGLSCQASPTGHAGRSRAGASPLGSWRAFVSTAGDGAARQVTRTFPLGGLRPGDGVFVSVYLDQSAGSARFFLAVPGGASYSRSVPVGAATRYTQAQALVTWSGNLPDPWPAARAARVVRFGSGGFTTVHGAQGTFVGPWRLTRWETAGSGRPAARPAAAPGYLTADGTQRVIGAWDDAFAVWLYR